MEYYKISENLKYACLKSKLQSIKTHPNTVILHKHKAQGKALSTPVSDINLAFLAALCLESKSEKGVLQQHVFLCLVFPDISSCEVQHIFNEAKLIDISVEGILSDQTRTPSSFHTYNLSQALTH